jgi:hypothetical protein
MPPSKQCFLLKAHERKWTGIQCNPKHSAARATPRIKICPGPFALAPFAFCGSLISPRQSIGILCAGAKRGVLQYNISEGTCTLWMLLLKMTITSKWWILGRGTAGSLLLHGFLAMLVYRARRYYLLLQFEDVGRSFVRRLAICFFGFRLSKALTDVITDWQRKLVLVMSQFQRDWNNAYI